MDPSTSIRSKYRDNAIPNLEIDDQKSPWKPKCVALSRSDDFSHDPNDRNPEALISQSIPQSNGYTCLSHCNYFKDAEWSADGTTVVTNSADHHVRTFILPPELLDDRECPLKLKPYSTLPSAEPVYSTALYPFFTLQDPSTTLFLTSVREHPIRLSSALAPRTLGTYSLVNTTTEAFITPQTLLYPPSLGGTHFFTGSDSLICLFDVSRPGNAGPVTKLPTIPSKRKQIVGGGVGMKGIVSAMAMDPSEKGILAAGTFTRCIALYGSRGSGELIGTFSIAKTEAERYISGKGITQLIWSPCGRYLYVAERKSQGMLVYDVRVTGQLLGWLEGRMAATNQRLKADLIGVQSNGSHDIWAGGTDGLIRVWRSPHSTVGAKTPDWQWRTHSDPVTNTLLHPGGDVLATCSGQKCSADLSRTGAADMSSSKCKHDNTLKFWSL